MDLGSIFAVSDPRVHCMSFNNIHFILPLVAFFSCETLATCQTDFSPDFVYLTLLTLLPTCATPAARALAVAYRQKRFLRPQ